MDLFEGLLTLTAIHFIATASPGPEFVLISKEALQNGRRAGFICLVGTMTGLLIHILYSAFGLAAIISRSPEAMLAIQMMGGSYLVYLGLMGLKAKPSDQSDQTAGEYKHRSDWQLFRSGFICDLLNPKAPIYYVALFTFVLSPDVPASHMAAYGIWIMLIHGSWFSVMVVLLSNPVVNTKFRRMGHWIDRILGGAMIAMGVKIITT
ncbi:LysE family translocator [Pontibacterium sp. N1Y112]|uniref:LysE family translocator n=1 Tax=Pontibacterium sinense TaxID=2781979 RepID=A0A8J7FBR4_9GAMM|nr:LysE family translocator [Pontibacterium sinense]MBE9398027.1 LysE family translocator [Pontibacterium sinense]